MSTANFITQKDFNLYVYVFNPSEEYIKEVEADTEAPFNYEDEAEMDYYFITEEAKREIEQINSVLTFHQLELRSGYYDGVQVFVNELYELDSMDNFDTRYEFDMCLSEAKRKYQAEINRINKKFLPMFEEIGFQQIRCIGVFSNGEAIYEKVA